ncbi:MAG: 30S ribosome-binding factor RbfA [Selenomonadaceae bacterium]|nr:30S ribosome-binding factor RbfA [Selenomonadaceae bacterium]MBR7025347.1 30S ribosome-binding factor RbfA [Selenomonadaceae bacterium]
MAKQLRIEKLQELIKQEMSKMLLKELKDPRIGFVTVTDVEMTGDLREAKIYVSVMGGEEKVKSSLEGLNSALGFIRREIGQRVRLRFTPEISFALDTSLDYGDHIQKLLLQVEGENKNVDNAQGGGGENQSRE